MADWCEMCLYKDYDRAEEPCINCVRDKDDPTESFPEKPPTNYDLLVSKTPEELAEYLSSICYDFWKMFVDDPKRMWLDWLKAPADKEE